MKLPCYLVQDLLPLYKDHVCDEQTACDVQAHLETCERCRTLLSAMEQPEAAETLAAGEKDAANAAALTTVRNDLRARQKKTALTVALLLLLLLSLFCGWRYWMMHSYVELPYEDLEAAHPDDSWSGDQIAFRSRTTGVYYVADGYVTKYYEGTPIAFLSLRQTRWEVLLQRLFPREDPIWSYVPGISVFVVSHDTYETLRTEGGRVSIPKDRLIQILSGDESCALYRVYASSQYFDSVSQKVYALSNTVRAAQASKE